MEQRDRNLAVARVLRKSLVAAGLLGSLGFAAVAALSTGGTSTAGVSTSQTQGPRSRGALLGTRSSPRTVQGGEGADDGGDDGVPVRPRLRHPARQQAPSLARPPGALQPGSGGPLVTTSGS